MDASSEHTEVVSTKPIFRGIVKLCGGLVFRDGKFVKDDLWFDTSVKKAITADYIEKFHEDNVARIVDPQRRFWDAMKYKDYAAHMEFDVSELLVVPGFIDIQCNGAFGVDFTSVPTVDAHGVIESTILQREGKSSVSFPSPSGITSPVSIAGAALTSPPSRPPLTSPSPLDKVEFITTVHGPEGSGFAHTRTRPTHMDNDELLSLSRTASRSLSRSESRAHTQQDAPARAARRHVAVSHAHMQTPSRARAVMDAIRDARAHPGGSEGDTLMNVAYDSGDEFEDLVAVGDSVFTFETHSAPCTLLGEHPSPPPGTPAALLSPSPSPAVRSRPRPPACEYVSRFDVDLRALGERLPQFGVTAYCPTVISSSAAVYPRVGARFRRYMFAFEAARGEGGVLRQAQMLGLHLEGPFISVKGAHDPAVLRAPGSFASVCSHYGAATLALTSVVTLAPELEGAAEAIAGLAARGIVASMGHSRASYRDMEAAEDAGARLVTHLFNAMTPFHHRDPGLVGLLGMPRPRVCYSVIADGIHAHPASVNIAFRSHPAGAVLVTDAMAAMGLGCGRYRLGEVHVEVRSEAGVRCAVVADTSTLAGAIEPLDQCVRNFRRFTGCERETAVCAASEAPARLLGVFPRKGSLRVGADADVVLLHPRTMRVLATIVNGQLAYTAGESFPPVWRPDDDE